MLPVYSVQRAIGPLQSRLDDSVANTRPSRVRPSVLPAEQASHSQTHSVSLELGDGKRGSVSKRKQSSVREMTKPGRARRIRALGKHSLTILSAEARR
jgi:hypothetical protein